MSRALRALPVLLLLLVAACGEAEREDAVEATEANEVMVGGVAYRVQLFRELNPYEEPSIYRGPPPPAGSALYVAFVRACAAGGEPVRASGAIRLENAFGERFEPVAPRPGNDLAYRPLRLKPEQCLPRPESVAARTFGGAALVFRVPLDAAAERPMVLEIHDPGTDETARVILDL
jgi:hypothetical protein